VTLIVIHHALEQVQDSLGLHTAGIQVAILQNVQQAVLVTVAIKQPLHVLWRNLWLFKPAQVIVMEIGEQLALV
jgi:hypothetical protein